MSDEHPTFPNPTIAEALCEIHFTFRTDPSWRAKRAGELFKVLQDEFPTMEPQLEAAVHLDVGGQGISQRVAPSQKMVFTHHSKPRLVQYREGVLTFNVLRPYPGWNEMRDELDGLWRRAASVLEPALISRVGLRYINRIPRESNNEAAGRWLKSSDYIAAVALEALPTFLSRASVSLDQNNRMIVALGLSDDRPIRQIVLDIDRITEEAISASVEELIPKVASLHEDVWHVFENVTGEKLEAHLRKEDGN